MRGSKLMFGGIADDLTGGLELASTLVSCGVPTDFRVGIPEEDIDPHFAATVVALKSRVIEPFLAEQLVGQSAQWMKRQNTRQVFFKYCATFDSTPRGNIGGCADVLMNTLNADRLIFCPGNPDGGRTVFNGHMFVGTKLLSNSPKRYDPLTPMTNSDLVEVLAPQTRYNVGFLRRSELAGPLDHVQTIIDHSVAAGVPYLIADTIDEQDLKRVAELTVDWPLMSGNSTVASYYPALWSKDISSTWGSPRRLGSIRGPGAVLAGSCAEQTLRQLDFFRASGGKVLCLDLTKGDHWRSLVEQAVNWAEHEMGEHDIAISTSASPEQVAIMHDRIGRDGAAEMAEKILATTSIELMKRGVKRLLVAGGETSGAVVGALGIKHMLVGPHSSGGAPNAEADVSVAVGVSKIENKIGICLKSGKLGAPDIFADRLSAMIEGRD